MPLPASPAVYGAPGRDISRGPRPNGGDPLPADVPGFGRGIPDDPGDPAGDRARGAA